MVSFLCWMRDAQGRRGVYCLPLALMEMETSHYGDKYKSGSSCVEGSSFFSCGWFLFFKPIEAISILWQIMKGCRFPCLPLQWNYCPLRDLLCFSVFDN